LLTFQEVLPGLGDRGAPLSGASAALRSFGVGPATPALARLVDTPRTDAESRQYFLKG